MEIWLLPLKKMAHFGCGYLDNKIKNRKIKVMKKYLIAIILWGFATLIYGKNSVMEKKC